MSEATAENTLAHHDLVARIAATSFNTQIFTVYTNTTGAQQRGVKGRYPHLVVIGKVSQRVEMVGMVETVASLHDLEAAATRWRTLERLQAATYLYVPRGSCADTRTLCLRDHVRISDFRHYWLDDTGCHVEKCFA
jgi:hypothetical protein